MGKQQTVLPGNQVRVLAQVILVAYSYGGLEQHNTLLFVQTSLDSCLITIPMILDFTPLIWLLLLHLSGQPGKQEV